jgi:RHS repeat-associated protein
VKTSDHNLRHPHRAPTGLPRLLCTLSIIAALASWTLAGATRGLNRDLNVADAGLFQVVFTGPRGGSGAAPANAYLFTGRRLDFDIREPSALSRQPSARTGGRSGRPLLTLYDYRARAYDPWHGRFVQRDPSLYAESLNLYQYALSNPLGGFDPSGRQSEIDSLILDLVAHRIVTMEYIAAGARLAQMGMQASLVMMELYISLKSPFAGAMLSGYGFAENPSWLGAADVAASVAGLGALDELGGYVLRWQARYSRLANRGGQAVKESLKRNLHHALPQFLGGLADQPLSGIPKIAHDFFHAALRDELVKAGFPRWLLGASRKKWLDFFAANDGAQLLAFEAVQNASKYTDARFGTSLYDDVLKRIAEGAFESP